MLRVSLAAGVAVLALPLSLIAELLPIRSYNTSDGLAGDRINKIVVDSRGFVWFSTPEGLSRFDGHRFVSFGVAEGLPSRSVNAILETRSGAYLVATKRGISEFQADGGAGAFTTYLPGNTPRENYVTALMQDSGGRIWCGTEDGLFEMLTGHSFRREGLPPLPGWDRVPVSDVLEDAGHKLWVATPDGIYVVGKGGAIAHIGQQDGLPSGWVEALLLDRQGGLWAATRAGLALMGDRIDGAGARVLQAYRGMNATALTEGPDRDIWAGSAAGLLRQIPGTRPAAFRMLTRAQGLIDRHVTALAADRAGNIWAGTEGAGVMKIQRSGFTTFHETDGLASDRIWSVLSDRSGQLLAVSISEGTGKHLVNVFDGSRFHALAPKVFGDHAFWGQDRILLQSRTGEWWAATKVGLCRFPPVKVADLAVTTPKACYAPDIQVFRVFEDSQGRVWASAQSERGDQLVRWDPATSAVSSFEKEGQGLVSAFAEDRDGAVWMGFWGGGLIRYDGRQFTRFKPGGGVPAGAIFALLVDSRGGLWIGSDGGGLGLAANPGSTPLSVKGYDSSSQRPAMRLASNSIFCLVEDRKGRIYAGTAKGVDRLDPRTGDIKHFSTADGLGHGELTSALRDASGDLWFATKQGLSRLTPAPDWQPAVPSVRITDLRVGRDRYPVSQVGETRIRRGDLKPYQNQVQVEFVGLNDEPEESLRYKYKLVGGESDWQGPGTDHQANYPGLGPGSYRFLVKAVNSEGRESPTPAEIDFAILPPVWRSWWFETLALVSLTALVFAAHRYRVAQAVRIERMRTTIATDLHDDIGASLSQIAILSEVARGDALLGQTGPNERLDRVATLARELVDSMSDIVWSIRAEPEGMDSLIRRMREFANDLLASQAIAFELRTPGPDTHIQLDLQARRQLLLIFKECVHNAVRHSGCTAVDAELCVEGRGVLLRVRDNGRGLPNGSPSPTTGGNGIPSMRRRTQSLGGLMEWTSGEGGGCTVEVRLPIERHAFRKNGP